MSRDRLEGLALLVLAIGYWQGAHRVPPFGVRDVVGPSAFPTLLAGVLGIAGAALVISGRPEEKAPGGRPVQVAAVFALLALYALLFERLGFLLTTFLFLSGTIAVFAPAWKRRIPVFAAVLTAILWMLFGWGLGVTLPRGLFGL